jgi:hypothetical protein
LVTFHFLYSIEMRSGWSSFCLLHDFFFYFFGAKGAIGGMVVV